MEQGVFAYFVVKTSMLVESYRAAKIRIIVTIYSYRHMAVLDNDRNACLIAFLHCKMRSHTNSSLSLSAIQ